jgi:hypothetical protein
MQGLIKSQRSYDRQEPHELTERDLAELDYVGDLAAAQRVLDRICPELRRLCGEIDPPFLGT